MAVFTSTLASGVCVTVPCVHSSKYSRPPEGGSPRRRFVLKGGSFPKVEKLSNYMFWGISKHIFVNFGKIGNLENVGTENL